MKEKALYRQYTLQSGTQKLACWLDEKIKVGQRVNLKNIENPFEWWSVIEAHDVILPKEEIKDAHESDKWYENNYTQRLGRLITAK